MRSSVQYLAAAANSLSTTTLSPSVTMRSASTVDEAVEAACAGDSHGAQTSVSAISRGQEGRRRHPGLWTAGEVGARGTVRTLVAWRGTRPQTGHARETS